MSKSLEEAFFETLVARGGGSPKEQQARTAHAIKTYSASNNVGVSEVNVKVIKGHPKTKKAINNLIEYITREKDKEVEVKPDLYDEFGQKISPDDAKNEFSDLIDGQKNREGARLGFHTLLSMPEGTPQAEFEKAVHKTLADQFAGERKYFYTFHQDTAHPHVHVIAASKDYEGQPINITKERLANMRSNFADRLVEEGILAMATSCISRGKGKESEPIGLIKQVERDNVELPKTGMKPEARTAIAASYLRLQAAVSELKDEGKTDLADQLKEAVAIKFNMSKTDQDKDRISPNANRVLQSDNETQQESDDEL